MLTKECFSRPNLVVTGFSIYYSLRFWDKLEGPIRVGRDVSTTLPAQQVVSEIKAALKDGLARHSSLTLEKVELSLKTLVEKNVGVGIEFTVPLINFKFEGGGDLTEESLQTLNLTLVPPAVQQGTKGLESVSIQEQLVEGIEAIAMLVEQAGKGEPKLAMSSSGIELNFTFTSEGKVSLLARAGGKKALTHTIKLYLKQV